MEDSNPIVQSCGYNVCSGCVYTNIEFIRKVCNEDTARQFLIEHGVLSCHSLCETCRSRVTADFKKNLFRCRKVLVVPKRGRVACDTSRSVFRGTVCEQMRLPLEKLCHLVDIFLSSRGSKTEEAMVELKLSSHTVVDWFSFCRNVVADYVERNSQCIGGVGKIVEIDAEMLGKKKYNEGRVLIEQWVIGGIERNVDGGCKAFLVPIENRNFETVIGVIQRYVIPGTTIMTDSWRGYDSLKELGYRHFTVNRSENFVDPQSGAHTQTIARLLVQVHRIVPSAGLRREELSGYLADVLFRRMLPCYGRRRHTFWKAAATLYTPEHTLA